MPFASDLHRSPGRNTAQRHSRGDSAVSALLGHAGQALGAVAAPSSSAATGGPELPVVPTPRSTTTTTTTTDTTTATTTTTTGSPPTTSTRTSTGTNQRQLGKSFSPSLGIGQHPQQLHPTSSSASPATDYPLHRQPPLQPSAAGVSGTGTGIGTGAGFGSNQRAVSATAALTSTDHLPPPRTYHNTAGSSSLNAHTPQFSSRPASYAAPGQSSLSTSSIAQDSRALPPPDVLVPGLKPSSGLAQGSALGSSLGSSSASGLSPRPMFDLPSIPTSNDDFASIPYLNSTSTTSSKPASTKDTMSQQQPYAATPRRPVGYDEQHHMQGSSQYQHGQLSPREYSTPGAGPHIKLDQASSNPSSYQSTPAVPGVLQPGPPAGRPPAVGATTAPTLPTMQGSMSQQQDYQAASKPTLSMSHNYTRSSPNAAYDASNPGYSPYTPTTPGGAGASSSQFMSPPDRGYNAPGSQRNISHTPLGLADIRPRADSSLSDGMPSAVEFGAQNPPPGTSNYMAPWATYAFDWCKWAPQGNGAGKVAMGSYLEDGHNFIQILDTQIVPTPSDVYSNHGGPKWTMDFTKIAEATHSYPVTRLLWEPPSSTKQSTDLLATSGDHLRLWSLPSDTPSNPGNSITGRNREAATTKLTPLALLSNSKTPDHTAPLTSLDWNNVSPSLIITSSIDTTCTIWDIPSLTAKTQLIAHDKEVYDVRFCANSVDVFVSCGQDGSVRMFDLRSLEHSTIIYEPTGKEDRVDLNGGKLSPTSSQQTMAHPPPLLRLATSPHDTQLLATFAQDSNVIRILDTRQPGQALLELRGHGGAVNCVDWSPTRRGQLASGADDCQVLLWDLMNQQQANGTPQSDSVRSPAASWQCDYEVGNLGWVPRVPNDEAGEWLGVSAGRGIWSVRM